MTVAVGTVATNFEVLILRFVEYKLVLKVFRRRFEALFVKLVELKVTFGTDVFKVPELIFRFDATIEALFVFI
jgi:hypothetical protein